jgi:LacI family transcriptional regulator
VVVPVDRASDPQDVRARVLSAGLDAVVYLGNFDLSLLSRLLADGPPAVLLDSHYPRLQVDSVSIDNEAGAFEACEHLLSLGHQDIAVVAGLEHHLSTRERLRGIAEAYDAAELRRKPRVHYSDYTNAGGFRAMQTILQGPLPTAVFFMNDEMAAGGIRAAHEHGGLKLPDDLSIIGFDDTIWAEAAHPQLTTVHVPTVEMGRAAVRRLYERLAHPDSPPVETRLHTSLVRRLSTELPRGR